MFVLLLFTTAGFVVASDINNQLTTYLLKSTLGEVSKQGEILQEIDEYKPVKSKKMDTVNDDMDIYLSSEEDVINEENVNKSQTSTEVSLIILQIE